MGMTCRLNPWMFPFEVAVLVPEMLNWKAVPKHSLSQHMTGTAWA